jgi:hypothetical protein
MWMFFRHMPNMVRGCASASPPLHGTRKPRKKYIFCVHLAAIFESGSFFSQLSGAPILAGEGGRDRFSCGDAGAAAAEEKGREGTSAGDLMAAAMANLFMCADAFMTSCFPLVSVSNAA